MADYHMFTSSRGTEPDPTALLAQLKAIDPTIGVQHAPGTNAYTLKKAAPWTPAEIASAQTAIDTAPVRDDAAVEIDDKTLKAIVLGIWEAIPTPLLTKAQLRARILAIYRTL